MEPHTLETKPVFDQPHTRNHISTLHINHPINIPFQKFSRTDLYCSPILGSLLALWTHQHISRAFYLFIFFSDTEWWPLSPHYFWFIVTCRTFILSRLFRVWGYAFLPLLCQPSHSFRTTQLTHIFKISKPPLSLVFSSPWCWLWNVLQSQSSNTNRSKLSRLGTGYEKSVYTFVSVHMESFIYISLLSTDNSVSCYLT